MPIMVSAGMVGYLVSMMISDSTYSSSRQQLFLRLYTVQ